MSKSEADLYRKQFLLDPEITYLNCSGMSPMLVSVREASQGGIELRAAPWKITSQDWFTDAEILRDLAAKIYQTKNDNIALIPSASYGIAAAAKNMRIPEHKNIIILENQFPSNVYAWQALAAQQKLNIIAVRKGVNESWTESILKVIDTNSGIVAVPNCHWMDGGLLDLEKISNAARSVKSRLVLDLSQSLGAMPIDIEKIDPDFAVSVGYKWLMGPLALGYMYVAPRWHDSGVPLEYNWITRKGSEDFSALTQYHSEYRTGARKFDMGQFSQFNQIPMAIVALRQILDWKIDRIQSFTKTLTGIISDRFPSDESNSPKAGHITGISLKNRNAESLKAKFAEKKIFVSFRDSFIRISPHLYNSPDDIDKLLSCLSD